MGVEAKGAGNSPIGSTQKVGQSVRDGRFPEEYDSSPILCKKAHVQYSRSEKGR